MATCADDATVVELLLRIATTLEEIAKKLETKASSQETRAQAPAAKATSPEPTPEQVAPDSDLISKYGDPVVKKDPPRWIGPPYAPGPLSAASPEWLEEFASFKNWQAWKAAESNQLTSTGNPVAKYYLLDAARARAWARHKRDGTWPAGHARPEAAATDQPPIVTDDIPF